jgi:hypothetical protein
MGLPKHIEEFTDLPRTNASGFSEFRVKMERQFGEGVGRRLFLPDMPAQAGDVRLCLCDIVLRGPHTREE